MSEVMRFVAATAWGRLLTPVQLERVAATIQERVVPHDGAICRIGTPIQYWKGVMEGLIKLSVVAADGRTSTLTGMAAGAWFGDVQLLRSGTWAFDAVAIRDTRIALVPRATFLWLMDVSPGFGRFIQGQLTERLVQFLSIIEAERLESPETRVARCLAWLFNPVLCPHVGSRLELTQQEVAYLSGTTRQRVNRALRLMEQAGVLKVEYGAIVVHDPQALHRFQA